MSKLQINLALILTLSALVLLPNAEAITIYVVDSNTGALLNATANITYNNFYSPQEYPNSYVSCTNSTGGWACPNSGTTNIGTNVASIYTTGTYSFVNNYMYVNYTKPFYANNNTYVLAQYGMINGSAQAGVQNISVGDCWNDPSANLQTRYFSQVNYSTAYAYSKMECYNGSAWREKGTSTTVSGNFGAPNTPLWTADTTRTRDGLYMLAVGTISGSFFLEDNDTWYTTTGSGVLGRQYYGGAIFEEKVVWSITSTNETVNAVTGITPPQASNYSTANITITSPGYITQTISSLALNYSTYTFNLTAANNVTFRFVDELTGATINTTTSVVQLSSSVYGTNGSTTNGTITLVNVTYSLYTVTYYATNYTQRTYTIVLPGSTTDEIVLYLLPTSEATTVRFTITDTNNFRLTNATVYINKKNTSGTNYYLVATCTTDTQGQCVSNVQLYDTTYQFYVYYNGAFRTNSLDTIVTTTEIAISVPLNRDPLLVFYQVPQISTGLTFDGTTATWTVLDGYGNVQQGCVRIYRRTGLTTQQINATCTTGAAFTISTTISTLIGDENYALGTVYVDGDQLIVARESIPNDDLDSANNTGLVLLAVVFAIGITLAMKYSWDMTTALVMFMLSTTMFWYVGLLQLSSFALVSVGVFLMIIIARNNQ